MNTKILLATCTTLGLAAFGCQDHRAEQHQLDQSPSARALDSVENDEDARETRAELRAAAEDTSREAHIDALEDRLDAVTAAVKKVEPEERAEGLKKQADAIDDRLDELDDDFGETLGNRPKANDYETRSKSIEQEIAALEREVTPQPNR